MWIFVKSRPDKHQFRCQFITRPDTSLYLPRLFLDKKYIFFWRSFVMAYTKIKQTIIHRTFTHTHDTAPNTENILSFFPCIWHTYTSIVIFRIIFIHQSITLFLLLEPWWWWQKFPQRVCAVSMGTRVRNYVNPNAKNSWK